MGMHSNRDRESKWIERLTAKKKLLDQRLQILLYNVHFSIIHMLENKTNTSPRLFWGPSDLMDLVEYSLLNH